MERRNPAFYWARNEDPPGVLVFSYRRSTRITDPTLHNCRGSSYIVHFKPISGQ
jgi:hypothetical protein